MEDKVDVDERLAGVSSPANDCLILVASKVPSMCGHLLPRFQKHAFPIIPPSQSDFAATNGRGQTEIAIVNAGNYGESAFNSRFTAAPVNGFPVLLSSLNVFGQFP
jgi:hypothetical protein